MCSHFIALNFTLHMANSRDKLAKLHMNEQFYGSVENLNDLTSIILRNMFELAFIVSTPFKVS